MLNENLYKIFSNSRNDNDTEENKDLRKIQ